jgi:hypothetical protein
MDSGDREVKREVPGIRRSMWRTAARHELTTAARRLGVVPQQDIDSGGGKKRLHRNHCGRRGDLPEH